MLESFAVKDRVAIVTGAGMSIGKAIALGMAEAGAHVVVAEIDPQKGEETAAEIRKLGRRAIAVPTDVTSTEQVEAMAAQLPIVATRTEGIPEVVVHGETGLLAEPGHPSSLADAMATVLGDPELSRRFARFGRERAEASFTIQAQAEAMQAIYQSLMRGGRRP